MPRCHVRHPAERAFYPFGTDPMTSALQTVHLDQSFIIIQGPGWYPHLCTWLISTPVYPASFQGMISRNEERDADLGLAVCLTIGLQSSCASIHQSICLSVCLSDCLSIYLSLSLSYVVSYLNQYSNAKPVCFLTLKKIQYVIFQNSLLPTCLILTVLIFLRRKHL